MSSLPASNEDPQAAPDPGADLAARLAKHIGPEAAYEIQGKLPTFRLPATALRAAAQRLKAAGFDYLILVTAVDYPSENRFEMIYVLAQFTGGQEFCLAVDIPRDQPTIPSVSDLWATADWHEREVYDLMGVHFENHPDLRRILLEDGWEGHPLRKDYEDKVHDVIKRPY